ncbi:MAG: cysteine desulfurase [Saprospiraceae bacterium]|nr:MAG: cysteine desulfurase [Saprospiraceae bacterium]
MNRIFLDNAATTPIDEAVLSVMTTALRENFGNPSSIHAEGRSSRAAIEQARKAVAHYIGASIGEIFFTSGGTESNNMVLKCAVRDLGVQRVISSPIEHHCVLHTLQTLQKTTEVEIVMLSLDEKGRIDAQELEQLLKDESRKTMVSLMHSNNEIGTMIDLDAIAELCESYGAYFHSDTVQTMGYFPINVSKTRIGFLSGSAHKFYGPKGVGFIYINSDNMIKPFVDGGSQERNMRGGTENLHGIIGLAKALELAYENREKRQQKIQSLKTYLKEGLESNFGDIQFNGDPEGLSHYKVLSVSFPASPKSDLLLLNLDIAGISVSGGSACSSGVDTGSHVINALHPESSRKTIRFSFSYHNTLEEIKVVLAKLKEIMPELALVS